MNYRNRVTRCRHGFAIGIVKCDACELRLGLPNKEYLKGSSAKGWRRRNGLREYQQAGSYKNRLGNI